MSYRKPSVAVYQLLENAGGAANISPDLEAVIVGPLNNVMKVDPNDGVSLANTKSMEISDWTGAPTDGGLTTFDLPFNSETAYPGQEVDAESVHIYLADAQVQTFEFDFDLKNNATKLDQALFEVDQASGGFGDAGTDPSAPLPGGYGAHVAPGDLVIAENLDGTYTSVVVAVERDADTNKVFIRIADPITYTDSVVSMLTTFKIYRQFGTFRVTDSASIDTSEVNALAPIVKMSVYTKPFPAANVPSDYVFRSPAEGAGEPISVHVGYIASRKDTVSSIQVINDMDDLKGKLGVISDENPLALGVSIALQNTVTSIKALAVESDDAVGYTKALNLLESDRVYFMVPLTQEESIISGFAAHCQQLSTPEEGMWRTTFLSTKIPTSNIVSARTGSETMSLSVEDGVSVLINSEATFISDGVTPGDVVDVVWASTSDAIGEYTVERVLNNQVLQLKGAVSAVVGIEYEVRRDLTRRQQAESVAAASATFGSNRVVHVQPDEVAIEVDGVTKWLPGYYLACGLAGMGAGFPVQQGFTNLGVVGISDLRHSNYYFTREELNLMAADGTCLFVQDVQGGLPYCRHELTTDMSVLEYREILKVKNWDYLSYFYKDLMEPFIGTWNITEDTLTNMRQTIISASERLMTQTLPKIGAPLMGYTIETLQQNPNSLDTVDIRILTAIVSPNNYTDISLVI